MNIKGNIVDKYYYRLAHRKPVEGKIFRTIVEIVEVRFKIHLTLSRCVKLV